MTSANPFPELNQLLSANAEWAADVTERDPSFFEISAKGQAPKVLWIGCSDSRVPETVVLACKPGDIFVHRNIANQFHPDDDSGESVLAFSVEVVGVEHVIVVGHTQCGGVLAAHTLAGVCPVDSEVTEGTLTHALYQAETTPLTRWLAPLVALAAKPEFNCSDPESHSATLTALSEENVRTQVENIARSDVVQTAWAEANANVEGRKRVYVHGWEYELATGRLRDLGISKGPDGSVETTA